ncbi:5621_t:CDS:2, partial [Racocetra persica]
DYHNIYKKKRPDDTNLLGAAHLATNMCKRIQQYEPVSVIFNGISVHNLVNIDVSIIEQSLYSMQDYLKILNIILKYNETTNYLNNYIIPVIADWPEQLFIRKAITQLHKNNSKSQILSGVILFVPILRLLYISLNSREQ